MPRKRISRRRLLQSTAATSAAAAATFAAPAFLRGQNLNSKLNIGVVGSGGRGGADTAGMQSENIVALCDVNETNLEAAAFKHKGAKKFVDFRDMFDKAEKDFDAVIVATTEHTHAMATMLALKAGKHVYCEKPLTHDIWEARQVREFAESRPKQVTQMGIQIHATDNYRQVVELIRGGAIGPVREAHTWVSRAWGLQSKEASDRNKDVVYVTERPPEELIPGWLNWDLWIGPAPYRPFNNVYVPGNKWYRWWDFGNGTMSDLGSHWNDLAFWALDLRAPISAEAKGPPPHPEIAPASMSVTYEYAARGKMPPVKCHWYQGESKPELWESNDIPQWKDGVLFIGDDGWLLSNYQKHVLYPEEKFKGITPPEKLFPRVNGQHHMEFVNACKGEGKTLANFTYAGWLTEANHLGNVAYRVGKKLHWDAEKMAATNAPEAAQYVRRERRKGWELP